MLNQDNYKKNARQKYSSVLICCGGGIDSTALIHYYLQKGFRIQGVHFDYGQPSCEAEQKAIVTIANYYGVNIEFAKIRPRIISEFSGEFLGRNTLLVLSALSLFKWVNGIISLGIHANAPYYDCTPEFCKHLQVLLDGYYKGTVRLNTPFLHFIKEEIFLYCSQNKVPVELTYSCETSSVKPCGICASCIERKSYDALC